MRGSFRATLGHPRRIWQTKLLSGAKKKHAKKSSIKNFPVLPFLVFWENGKENPPKNKDFFPYRTPKIPGSEEKNAQKKRIASQRKKQGIPKKKGKEGQGLGPPRPPPFKILCVGLFLFSEGKEAPNIKDLRGQGPLGGGGVWEQRQRFLPKFFTFMLFFGSSFWQRSETC